MDCPGQATGSGAKSSTVDIAVLRIFSGPSNTLPPQKLPCTGTALTLCQASGTRLACKRLLWEPQFPIQRYDRRDY